jgi:hypothetical protein
MSNAESLHERRITVRLLAYWEKLRGARPMPGPSELDAAQLRDLWDYCFLVSLNDGSVHGHHYLHLGDAIHRAYHGQLDETDEHSLVSPNADRLADCYMEVMHQAKPLVDEGEFRNANGDIVKYRQCLLPLGEQGQVTAIFGGMRYRIYPAK